MNRAIGISGESTKVDNKNTLKSIKATSLRVVAFNPFFFLYPPPKSEASSTKTTYQEDSQLELDLKPGQTQALLVFYNLHSKRGNKCLLEINMSHTWQGFYARTVSLFYSQPKLRSLFWSYTPRNRLFLPASSAF